MWWIKKKKRPKLTKEQRLLLKLNPAHQRSELIKKLDETFSLIVRIEGGWECVKCHRVYPPTIDKNGIPRQKLMNNSHYFGRGDTGGRWEKKNCDPMDIFCHQKVENNKERTIEGFNYKQYMIDKLGQEEYDRLEVVCNGITKYTSFELGILLKEMQKELHELINRSAASGITAH